MTETGQAPTEPAPKDVIGFLDYYLVKKAPFQLPDDIKEFLVKFGPWITIVLIVLTLPALLFVLGIGTMLVPFAGADYATDFGVVVLAVIVDLGLTVAALPGLFARRMYGWKLLFYARIAALIAAVLAGSIVSAVLVGVISMYILFQIRPLYKA